MLAQPSGPFSDPRQKKIYYFHVTPVRRVLTPLVEGIFRIFTIIRASGVENFPEQGPVVLAANHLTNYDVFPMQFVLPRPIFYMGKEELFRNPTVDWVFRQLGGFPVYRGERDEWALGHARRVLEHGQVLGIFPEGKRSEGKGLHPAKTGAARLALAAGCPIVPIALHGPQYIFRRFPRRTEIQIHVGKALLPEPHESPLSLTDRLMFTLADMLPRESRGVYARHPPGF